MLLSLKSYRLSLRGEAASLVSVREVQQKNKDTITGFDKIALSQVWALPIFILISAIIFYLSFGAPTQFISSIIEKVVSLTSGVVFEFMCFAKFPKWFVGLVADGIINGVGSIFAFLPQNAFITPSFLMSGICVMSMPSGLTAVFAPAPYGVDTQPAAEFALLSHVLSIITIPLIMLLFAVACPGLIVL
jgi:hypothetical protein